MWHLVAGSLQISFFHGPNQQGEFLSQYNPTSNLESARGIRQFWSSGLVAIPWIDPRSFVLGLERSQPLPEGQSVAAWTVPKASRKTPPQAHASHYLASAACSPSCNSRPARARLQGMTDAPSSNRIWEMVLTPCHSNALAIARVERAESAKGAGSPVCLQKLPSYASNGLSLSTQPRTLQQLGQF